MLPSPTRPDGFADPGDTAFTPVQRAPIPNPAHALIPDPARALMPDLARALALFGIAVVNVGLFAWPGTTGYTAGGLLTPLDRALHFAVLALFAFKSYSLFAFSFGVGFGQQMRAAQVRGAGFGARYTRRLVGLAALGVLNVVAFFHGDILLVYALLGALLFLFRHAPVTRLWRWGLALYALQVVVVAAVAGLVWLWATMAPQDMAAELARLPDEVVLAVAGFGAPDFAQVAAHRVQAWQQDIGPALMIQGPGALAFFLLGLAAWRSGLLDKPADPFWRRCRRRYLVPGLALSAAGAALMVGAEHFLDPHALLGLTLITLASPWASAGYMGLVARWAQAPDSALRRFVALAGSASLSAYLLQGLLLSLVFSGYGLGLYAQAGAALCIGIAAVAGVASLTAAGLWRSRFARGPVEALLRGWTYRGRR